MLLLVWERKTLTVLKIINQVVELDSTRKATQTQLDNQSAEMNNLSKEIGLLFKQGKQAEAYCCQRKNNRIER